MFVVIVSAAVVLNLKKKDFMLLPEKIEQLMNSTPMKLQVRNFLSKPQSSQRQTLSMRSSAL